MEIEITINGRKRRFDVEPNNDSDSVDLEILFSGAAIVWGNSYLPSPGRCRYPRQGRLRKH